MRNKGKRYVNRNGFMIKLNEDGSVEDMGLKGWILANTIIYITTMVTMWIGWWLHREKVKEESALAPEWRNFPRYDSTAGDA